MQQPQGQEEASLVPSDQASRPLLQGGLSLQGCGQQLSPLFCHLARGNLLGQPTGCLCEGAGLEMEGVRINECQWLCVGMGVRGENAVAVCLGAWMCG